MGSLNTILKTIRSVSKSNPVTNLQLSEMIRTLWRDPVDVTSGIVVTQLAHGFTVGTPIKPTAAGWVKTKADSAANAGTVGVVSEVVDVDHFRYIESGSLFGEYSPGAVYILSPITAGIIIEQADIGEWDENQVLEIVGTANVDGSALIVKIGCTEDPLVREDINSLYKDIDNLYEDIGMLEHNGLEGLQGGDPAAGEYGDFYHLTSDEHSKLHPPVSIAAVSANIASIDENQELTINNLSNLSVMDILGDLLQIIPLPLSSDIHNPWMYDCSVDGSVIIASAFKLYISLDFGATWVKKELYQANTPYGAPRCSIDGSIMWVGNRGVSGVVGRILVSSDYGSTWTEVTPPISSTARDFLTIGVSQDGNSAIVGSNNGGAYKTTNRGNSWVLLSALGNGTANIPSWSSFAISNDGNHIIASPSSIDTLISTDGGLTFINYWRDVKGWPQELSTPAAISVVIKGDKSGVAISVDAYNNVMGNEPYTVYWFYYGLEYMEYYVKILKSSFAACGINKSISSAVGFGYYENESCICTGSISMESNLTYYKYNANAYGQVFPGFINEEKSLLYFTRSGLSYVDDFGKILFGHFVTDFGTAKQLISEQLSGVINTTNRIFTTSKAYTSGSISVFINGIKDSGFSETDETTITLDEAPSNVGFTDKIEAIYSSKN